VNRINGSSEACYPRFIRYFLPFLYPFLFHRQFSLTQSLGISLTKALTISRTESIRALREAQSQSFYENPNIVHEWQWQAALDDRTCIVCVLMHGQVFPYSKKLENHPNCRCVMVPKTLSWKELGKQIGVDFSGIDEMGASVEEQ